MNNNIYNILNIAFNKKYSHNNIKEVFEPYLLNGIKFKVKEKNTQYINSDTEIRCIHLLLGGKCHVINYTVDGKEVVVDSPESVQMFGLYEAIRGLEGYSSTIRTINRCCFIEIPTRDLQKALEEDINTANIVISYLAGLTESLIAKNYMELVNSSIQNFLLYLYKKSKGKVFPYRIKTDRKTMAAELNVSLRTIYRYIDEVKSKNIICINSGKIEVTQEQFVVLEKNIGSFC